MVLAICLVQVTEVIELLRVFSPCRPSICPSVHHHYIFDFSEIVLSILFKLGRDVPLVESLYSISVCLYYDRTLQTVGKIMLKHGVNAPPEGIKQR